MKIALFDIDGTLLWSNGAGRRAMEAALVAVFGSSGPRSYHFDGKTDLQIVRELMRGEGHDDGRIDLALGAVMREYLVQLDEELASPNTMIQLLGGAVELLDALAARDDCVTGLLTGNVEHGAAKKLAAVGMSMARFPIGAFGSDHEIREELPAIAQRRASDRLGFEVPGESLVIIGDTPADVRCGRRIGARAIAVATGRYTLPELQAHQPAAAFQDLRVTDALLRAIVDG